jgi:hypothetical protein
VDAGKVDDVSEVPAASILWMKVYAMQAKLNIRWFQA